MVHVRRRQFLTLLGSAAAAWPLAARGQRSVPLIGFLNSQSPGSFSHMVAGFHQGLAESGYVDGRNTAIEYRWAEGQYERLPGLADDLVSRRVAVLVATGGEPAAIAAKAATAAIPIVFLIGDDPVNVGLVDSMNRPGGNVTGLTLLTTTIDGKRIGLLREMVPKANSIAALINPDFPPAENQRRRFLEAASRTGLRASVAFAKRQSDFEPAFATLEKNADVLIVCADPLFNSRRNELVALAASHRLPAIYEFREFSLGGGLMSYGVNIVELYREVGHYTGRILKGAIPSELPVLQPAKFDFAINLKTARELGLEIPDRLLAIADEVIE
jgi:putative tryptophan/tyrosine transport system substrate-binding protein